MNGANSITFGYDRDGLLTAAGGLGLKRAAPTGFLERDSVGTVLGVWGYDPKGALASYSASAGGTGLFQTSYVRDSLSRITELTETVQGVTTVSAFTYDSAGRLATVRRDGTLTASYHYDANGNRLDVTTPGGVVSGSYDSQDRLTSYGTASYSYTANGELREKVVGTDTTRYTYDALGNLVQVRLPAGILIDYVIDPQNRRIGKKVDGVLVQGLLYQDQLAPVAELDGAGQVVSRFVYATRGNVPDYLIKAGQTYRLVLDHLGSVRLVVNAADGTVVQRLDYDEFGQVSQNTNPGFQPFGYAGGLYDQQTGLVRFGARDYAPVVGRWTAKDPIRFGGGQGNLYAYVAGDPIDFVDPTGDRFRPSARFWFDLWAFLAGAPQVERRIEEQGLEKIPRMAAGTRQVEGIGSEEVIGGLNGARKGLRVTIEGYPPSRLPLGRLFKGGNAVVIVISTVVEFEELCDAQHRADYYGHSVWYQMLVDSGAAPEPQLPLVF